MEATDIYDYFRAHANELGSRILESYAPLQSMTDEVPAELTTLLRTLLPAQAIAIGGLAKHFRSSRAARIVAECGAGKSHVTNDETIHDPEVFAKFLEVRHQSPPFAKVNNL